MMENLTEAELIKHCTAGNRSYQELFYKKYASKMFGVCLGYANCRDDAKDILQDGFVKVFAALKNYNGSGSLEGWIRRIIVNTAIDYCRKALKDQKNIDVENAGDIQVEVSVLEKIHAQELMELIHKLPEGARTIFNLYVVEGYSHGEIAEMLDISTGTSKSQFSRARTLLQKWVSNMYDTRMIPGNA
ncbi:MAG: sigma-70 family RNA polymerase sigma factor [Bacteroidetes bacterium]|nr:sigma-70 family RNA polymerase sigma factor [Bacteroidota bacterium]